LCFEAAGLPAGTGPHRVITDLCVMDFHPETKRMQLKSLHPGKTLDQVRAATGFEHDVCDPLTTTVEPNDQQLTVLRTDVDPGRYILGRTG
jgi:glutaconate CoA-transferase subunit B